MPKSTTATTADQSNEPAGLIALREKIAELQADAGAAHAEQSQMEEEAKRLQQQALQQHARKEKLAAEIARAEREALDLIRQTKPPRVTRQVAVDVARTLLGAFAAVSAPEDVDDLGRKRTVEQRADSLWQAIDNVRCRLLTDEIDPDARPVVLAIEGILMASDDFERYRRPEFTEASDRNELADVDPRAESSPATSRTVQALLKELDAIFDGREVARPAEGIGELIAQNVTLNQICRMHGLVNPDGSPALDMLGQLIDRSLGTSGFYREANWLHMKQLGALNRADAWKLRSLTLEARRKASHLLPGAAQLAGTYRPGRIAGVSLDDTPSIDLKTRDYRHQQAKAEAAATARLAASQPEPMSDEAVRAGIHEGMRQ